MNPTSANIDVLELTVAQIQAAFDSGAMTSEALTSAYLERIAQVNPRYNAIIFMNPQALDDARAIDRRRKRRPRSARVVHRIRKLRTIRPR